MFKNKYSVRINKMKKIILILLILSVIVALASCGGETTNTPNDGGDTPPAVDNGGEENKPEEIKYSQGLEFISRDAGTCSLKGIGSCTDTDIIVPLTSPLGETVTSIDASAFEGVTSIVSITIPAVKPAANAAKLHMDSVIPIIIAVISIPTPISKTPIPDNVQKGFLSSSDTLS